MRVRLLTTSGVLEVDATQSGPFAVHQDINSPGCFAITHVASGARFPAHFESQASAEAAASELQSLRNYWESVDPADYQNEAFKSRAKEIIQRNGGQLYKSRLAWDGERLPPSMGDCEVEAS